MKTLYIHSGLPKNGSSALQSFFAQNIENLRSCGIEYFEIENIEEAKKGGITSGNGALLSRWLLPQTHPMYYENGNIIYKKLFELSKKCNLDIGIISSEFFANIPLDRLEKIKNDFSADKITVKFIYYVRRQDQHMASAYLQEVKRHGATISVAEFVKKTYKCLNFLNYYRYTKTIEEVLGVGNVMVSIFDDTKNHRCGLAGHFIESIIGETPGWINHAPIVNTSPSILEVKLMLLSNRFKPRMRFSDMLIEDSIRCGRSKEYAQHSILGNELTDEILKHFSDENNKFENCYCSGSRFAAYEPATCLQLDEYSYSADEVMDIISGFLVRYDCRISVLESLVNDLRQCRN